MLYASYKLNFIAFEPCSKTQVPWSIFYWYKKIRQSAKETQDLFNHISFPSVCRDQVIISFYLFLMARVYKWISSCKLLGQLTDHRPDPCSWPQTLPVASAAIAAAAAATAGGVHIFIMIYECSWLPDGFNRQVWVCGQLCDWFSTWCVVQGVKLTEVVDVEPDSVFFSGRC